MIRLLPILLCLPAHALVSTNSDAITTAPSSVGWDYTSVSGEACAISTNIFVTVAHQPERGLVWSDGPHHVAWSIIPHGVDIRFSYTPQAFAKWTPVFSMTNEWKVLDRVFLIGGGVGTGAVVGNTYAWSTDLSTRMKRWGTSGYCMVDHGLGYFVIRSDNCGTSSGDSGGAVFTGAAEYLGPIKFGTNPMTIGQMDSGGVPVYPHLNLVQQYMPGATHPKPVAPTKLTVSKP